MAKRLYVGNLVFSVTSADLRTLFAAYGVVESAQVQVDRDTGKGRGFGFVVMENEDEAAEAIARLDGSEYQNRRLNVNEAQPKVPLVGPGRGERRRDLGPRRPAGREDRIPGGRS